MNKLLIALGTVAFAASLQAASVVWGGAIAAPDYTTSGNSAEYPATAYLLYAATDEAIQPDNSYQMSGNRISVKTLDLNREFSEIAAQLNTIVTEHFGLRSLG